VQIASPKIMNMYKRRGSPDQRGMGAQSDFIAETFLPSAEHEREQVKRARVLIANGLPLSEVANLLSVQTDWLNERLRDGSPIHSRE